MVNLYTNKVARILGKVENNDRFLRIALYLGDRSSKKVRKMPTVGANANENKEPLTDPTLVCCAFKKHRIYLFRYTRTHCAISQLYIFMLERLLGRALVVHLDGLKILS